MNPFSLTGWEAMLTTGIVCWTVAGCVAVSGVVTVKVTGRVCEAVEKVAASIASIWVKR